MTMKERFASVSLAVREIIRNRVTLTMLAIAAVFWLLVPVLQTGVIPGVGVGSLIAALRAALIGLSLAIAFSYLRAAINKVREGDSGAVTQWLVGIVFYFTAVAAGSIYTLVWIVRGRPDDMTVSALLAFILLSQAVGQSMLVTSPGATGRSIPRQNFKWLIGAAVVAALIVGFTVGTMTAKTVEVGGMVVAENRPACRADRPVWVSETGIYHNIRSRYRPQIEKPIWCFKTEREARMAGFRPPR